MKNNLLFKLIAFLIASASLLSCISKTGKISDKALEKAFVNPPDSVQTSVYWYWISDNISKEGVVNDLEAMKKAGINRAFIGNIGLNDIPYGKVKMLSEEWWDILHTALKTATKLNIEIGIFNSPGWSQSGGPWVSSNEAMRYLTSSELRVTGPIKLNQKLVQPLPLFQDVRVIAYPAPVNDMLTLNMQNANIKSSPQIKDLANLVDGDIKSGISYPESAEVTIDIQSKKPFTARSLVLRTTEKPQLAMALLQVAEADGTFRTISEFQVNRSNPALNVGFEPYAPIAISFAEVTSTHFRLIIQKPAKGTGLSEISLSPSPRVEMYAEKTLAKMHPTPLPYWHEYQWPPQPEPSGPQEVIDGDKVIDISKFMSVDGTLTWDVPEGDWVIMRTGMTPTGTKNSPASPEATGYEVDKMSKEHVAMHFAGHMGEILKRIPEADRKTFKVVVQDSYEMGGQNFTDGFIDEFMERYGYDPMPYLPVYQGYVVNSEDASDRFLWDLRRLIADKVAYDYVGGLREISHQNGLHTWLECYGHWGFPGEFLMYGGQSDEIGGEFWSEGELGNIENRAASSCGHIYGKQKISAESNTCSGAPFSRYPGVIKQRGDRFFAEGINNTLLHVYITQPYEEKSPGMNAWFGNEFNRKNTWFSQMDVYTAYLKRTNFMLQQGLNVADVAYFIGEDAPKMTGIVDPPLPAGYQFDYMNAEVIEKYMTVKDGLLALPHGTQYRMMVLPRLETMRPELLSKIAELVKEGAVIYGTPPLRSPSLQDQPAADALVKQLAEDLWGNADGLKIKSHEYGKGMIINGMTMEEALALVHCSPDCKLPSDRTIHYGHRTSPNGEIYFISNQTSETQIVTPEFRVKGLQPELWEAATGSIRPLPAYETKGEATSVPLKLAPYESVFVVFRHKAGNQAISDVKANYPDPAVMAELKGPWSVMFDTAQRGPAEPVVFDTLYDWTRSADERIRYYSGTALYTCKFNIGELPHGEKILADLGRFTAMAKVYLNGKYAGGLWTAPYHLDITQLVKTGENELKVEIVNTWVNRLIGDMNLPAEQRKTWCPVNSYKATSPLQPSGLFGPVTISANRY
jgi:hypothetical protein